MTWLGTLVLRSVPFRFQTDPFATLVGPDRAMPLVPPSFSLGLEEEYLLVDPASHELVAAPPAGPWRAVRSAWRRARHP